MWRLAFRIMQPISVLTADRAKVLWNFNKLKYTLVPVVCTSIYYLLHHRDYSLIQLEDQVDSQHLFDQARKNAVVQNAKFLLRFIELGFIFTPSFLCLPLCLFDSTRGWWIQLFLHAVQKAGIVWIKAFQYLSHRRDIIGEEMALQFQVLREHSPQHEFKDTVETIERVYGKSIDQMFEEFDIIPIASGSVSQIYKAKLHGKKVAVKVRHPRVDLNLTRDIDLMFKFSGFLSFFSKFFEIPITSASLKKILSEQILFLKQKKNIDLFNTIKVDSNVTFPLTYAQSTNQVLIEQFIEGKTIGFYQTNKNDMNKAIANIGAKAFFSMLMKYNMVHADCHAGNILVQISDQPHKISTSIMNWVSQTKNYILAQVIKYGFNSQFLRRLSQDHYEYQKSIQKQIDQYHKKVKITLIDVGMAISLTEEKKKSLQSFLQQVIKGDPLQCAKWIYKVSLFNGLPLKQLDNQKYFNDLVIMFKRVHLTALQSLQGLDVLKQMLVVVRDHNMKIDGQISILLTNMLVLEAIAKDLDPNINILRCAVPYLQYRQ